jgi:hypothetical protein
MSTRVMKISVRKGSRRGKDLSSSNWIKIWLQLGWPLSMPSGWKSTRRKRKNRFQLVMYEARTKNNELKKYNTQLIVI